MTQQDDLSAPPGTGVMEKLEVELQRFSVGAAESQTAATVDEDQEDDSSSSSSESSAGLPAELHPGDGTRAGPLEPQAPTAPSPNDAAVGLLYDQSMEQHFGPDHFERPARIIQLHATLHEQGLMARCWQLVPRRALDEELRLCHSEEYIRKVDSMFSELYPARPEALADSQYCYADGRMHDVYICEGTARAARVAAGCCVQAVQSVLSGAVNRAMAVVRPPGHHAECERAMGFCFFNNVAVAALVALQHPGVKRVAVLDWDVHHGNGIQHMLLQRPDALYISIHRDPKRFYPYHSGFLNEAGDGPGTGFNVNVPWLKKGMGDGDYMAAFSLVVEPILESYNPDLVIVAAGFDAADGDPLGGCKLSPEGYAWMTERLMRLAGGKLVLALEGGYNNRVTSWCAASCVRALLEGRASPELPRDKEHMWPSESHNSLKMVYEFHRQHWPVLRSRTWTEAWEGHLKEVHRLLGANVRSKRPSSGAGVGTAQGNGGTCTADAAKGASEEGTGAGRAASGRTSSGGGAAAARRRSSSNGSAGASASGGQPLPAPPQSLQEAFKARKAARAAAAVATDRASPAAVKAGVPAAPASEQAPASAATPTEGAAGNPGLAAAVLPKMSGREAPTQPPPCPPPPPPPHSVQPQLDAPQSVTAAATAAAANGVSASGTGSCGGGGGGGGGGAVAGTAELRRRSSDCSTAADHWSVNGSDRLTASSNSSRAPTHGSVASGATQSGGSKGPAPDGPDSRACGGPTGSDSSGVGDVGHSTSSDCIVSRLAYGTALPIIEG